MAPNARQPPPELFLSILRLQPSCRPHRSKPHHPSGAGVGTSYKPEGHGSLTKNFGRTITHLTTRKPTSIPLIDFLLILTAAHIEPFLHYYKDPGVHPLHIYPQNSKCLNNLIILMYIRCVRYCSCGTSTHSLANY